MKKNTKGFLFYEFALVAFSLVLLGLVLFTFSIQGDNAKKQYEQSAPNLKNPFPISFVQSFLYIELNDTQKERLLLSKEEDFRVINLLQREFNKDIEGEIYDEIRMKYIHTMVTYGLLDQYMKTPLSTKIVDINHLLVRTQISSLSELDCLEEYNYAFYIPYSPKISSTLVVVLFESSTSCAIKNIDSKITLPRGL